MIAHAIQSFLQYLRTPAVRSVEEFGDAIEEEIAFHVTERTRDYMAQGMSEDEAQRAAHAKFGNPSRVAAECHAAAIGAPVLWHRLHLALTTALTAAVMTIGFTSRSTGAAQNAIVQNLPSGIASMLDNDWTGSITGQIVDEQKQPIQQARVLVTVKTWPDGSYFQRAYTATTDANGGFLIQCVYPVNERYEVQIAAVAPGRALKSSYHGECRGVLEPVRLELPPASGLVLNIQSDEGTILTGVEVIPTSRVQTDGASHQVYFDSAQSLVQTTDNHGSVQLPYFQPGDTASLLLRTTNGDWQPYEVDVPTSGNIVTIRISSIPENHSREI